MWYALVKYRKVAPDDVEVDIGAEVWRVVSGPHRSKIIAMDTALWEHRRAARRQPSASWQAVEHMIGTIGLLRELGLAPADAPTQSALELKGSGE